MHARRGQRDSYLPLSSRLCASCEPAEVIAGLLRLHGFSTVYLADLDAIRGRGNQTAVIQALRRQFPDIALWVDPGIDTRARYAAWQEAAPGSVPVVGSETLAEAGLLADTLNTDGILSLDFSGDTLLGPPDLLESPERWPRRVMVMCLDRVGTDAGPDTERLQQLQHLAPGSRLYAAGGVRDLDDLLRLQQVGLSGAVLASALHDGRIGPAQIAALA